jgi:hypothetical protein
MSAVAEVIPHQQVVSVTPMQMLSAAMEKGIDTAQLEKLLDLQERWEKTEAKRAFTAAFSAFKSEAVTIVKGTLIKDGPLKGQRHANLHDVVIATTPKLSAHGLAISWKLTRDDKDWMEVTCILSHVAGHSESVSMGAAPDTGPGRNAIQARGSAKTYLERYTATAILGLAAADQDNDGQGGEQVEKKHPPEYVSWKADMAAVADEGVNRLSAEWEKIGKDRRKYVTTNDFKWWEDMKARAQKADQK